jgi:hypothetical protein
VANLIRLASACGWLMADSRILAAAVATLAMAKPTVVSTNLGNDGYGFHVGNQISTLTHTRENPTCIPAGYMISVVHH